MNTVYFLVISVLFNGAPIQVPASVEYSTLPECRFKAALFVQRVIGGGYTVTTTCVRTEVNSS